MSKDIVVIGFVGKMGSGKTTAAKYLVDKIGYRRLRMADSLKRMLREGLGIDPEYIDGELKNQPCPELCGRTARHAMVTLGTEWGRDLINPNIWVNAVHKQLCEYMEEGHKNFVIDDIRFLNEAIWVRSLSNIVGQSYLIRIIRFDTENKSGHRSETEQDGIAEDATIYNNSDVEALYDNMLGTLYYLLAKE